MKSSLFSLAIALGLPLAGALPAVGQTDPAPRRPNLGQACNAWREHIGGLIEQHRVAGQMDEKELFGYVRDFVAARNNCAPGRYETGLRMYEAIPLTRPVTPLK